MHPKIRNLYVRFSSMVVRALALGLVLLWGGLAHAQSVYPDKPIRLLVSFAVGSGNDVLAREIAKELTGTLGQPVVVENRLGAGGMIATNAVAQAAPDGYLLGFGTSSQLVMNVGFYKSLPFNIDKDLTMIALLAKTNMVLDVSGNGAKTLAEFVQRAKAEPDTLTYGSGGNGSISHILGEAFAQSAGVKLRHIPYKGGGSAVMDVAAGRVDMMFDGLNNGAALAAAGKIRLLAISGSKRSPLRPDVPTFEEAGMKDFEAYTWNAIFGPANMPPAVLQRLNTAINQAMASAGVKAFVERNAGEIMPRNTPEQAEAFARSERARWVPFMKKSNIAEQ
ncbi:Bug family tripartite tricarboxylate transporter substrate binding protein [Ottowia thiooxydans]|uniref:Tripartite-type tricarboxylate transporter receptor subunit TctC n=1 Tax=Ottowia thiooxydans TaxID=219182 RepID=A0ABV2Q4I3_9BURK